MLAAIAVALALIAAGCSDDGGDGGSGDGAADGSTPPLTHDDLDVFELQIGEARVAAEDAMAAAEAVGARVEELESKETIRSILLAFTAAIGTADVASLEVLLPWISEDVTLSVVEFGPDPETQVFEGHDGLLTGFGPIIEEAQANLMPSAIDVGIQGDRAAAQFKFANSVVPPLGINDEIDVKVLLFRRQHRHLQPRRGRGLEARLVPAGQLSRLPRQQRGAAADGDRGRLTSQRPRKRGSRFSMIAATASRPSSL